MKITWQFNDKSISELEVTDEIGTFILDSRRKERALAERERYHCPYSYDAITYEGMEYADPQEVGQALIDDEDNRRLYTAFSKLSEVQRRRLLMLANGLSLREIARREGVDIKTVRESVEGARKKFLKFF